VFFGGKGVMRGKAAVAADWKRFFDGPSAPFSWAPAEVEVLPSGNLGFTSGPVYDPKGQRVGTFNSVWQRQADGSWKVIFDKGCPPCECVK
jgi:ketosteroid isomerase-like protein